MAAVDWEIPEKYDVPEATVEEVATRARVGDVKRDNAGKELLVMVERVRGRGVEWCESDEREYVAAA